MKLFDLNDKAVVVTGGNRGIGFALAKGFHQFGAKVIIAARDQQRNQQACDAISANSERVFAVQCDVTCAKSVEYAFEQAENWAGGLYGCIANAGVRGAGCALDEVNAMAWRATLTANLEGTMNTFQAAIRPLKAYGEGRLIAVSSLAALHGNALFTDYSSAKAGIEGLCRALAIELAPHNITVNCVMPGWVDTDMNADVKQDKRLFESIKRLRVPLKRWASAEEMVGSAVYLMSGAGSYHTGDTLRIDGGYHIG
ncbi:SDR family NAD(P)-dependent oxidoreductase [Pseudoalteromonas luteoviolacea]|uniref:SDR family NAD(P)-dependent oxidoreductase n=1 Tax=Pseudoalteromonas luteoviolacea TaxID=43657 RepID=UPI00114EB809|nr:SDR family NAD(P)-dependent oxidoreductase [Pseudoalteromonas luteoviolacea]TQF72753.1 SDR family oxidoreductase [Pseudoalteromonas luteoviolacea]